jgi:hypothetical protein
MFVAIVTLANVAALVNREIADNGERKGAFCRFLGPPMGRSRVEMTHPDGHFGSWSGHSH